MLLILAVTAMLALAGCGSSPTTISVALSFLNSNTMNRAFPPALHSTIIGDDIAYIRLIDNDGLGAVLRVSSPISLSSLTAYTYDGVTDTNTTPEDGVYIDTVNFILSDSEVSAATMPLRLEAYFYDTPPGAAGNPLDPARYSYYSAAYDGDQAWTTSFTISGRTLRKANLAVTMPIP